jgi:hypothetical protein
MMETKLNLFCARTTKWFAGIVLMLGLLWTSHVNAQLVSTGNDHRDSTLMATTYTRAQLLSVGQHAATALLDEEGYVITDLINASYEDFINAGPDQTFMNSVEFYALNAVKKWAVIYDPTKYKIYKLRDN